MLIVDAHLDLSYNAMRGRDVTVPAAQQSPDDEGIASVGLPDLRNGGVGLICATIFCRPEGGGKPGYRTADEAWGMARKQLEWYQQQAQAGRMAFVSCREDLAGTMEVQGVAQRAILLMEGADPLRSVEDVLPWYQAGLRIVGLAWKQTRYAGGTGEPGSLSAEGREMVKALDATGMIHDVSHMAEGAFWRLMELSEGPVMASHSNCRAIVPTDRQLSDEMIEAIGERGGIVGINFFDKFLLCPEEYGKRRATLADVVRHVRQVCQVVGDARRVGLGTDMDGGVGRDQLPVEIRSSADLPRVAETLGKAGFGDEEVRGIMGENWVRFFEESLPLKVQR